MQTPVFFPRAHTFSGGTTGPDPGANINSLRPHLLIGSLGYLVIIDFGWNLLSPNWAPMLHGLEHGLGRTAQSLK